MFMLVLPGLRKRLANYPAPSAYPLHGSIPSPHHNPTLTCILVVELYKHFPSIILHEIISISKRVHNNNTEVLGCSVTKTEVIKR